MRHFVRPKAIALKHLKLYLNAVTLDAYLALKGLTRIEFGRMIRPNRPHTVRMYFRRLADGSPNRYYHPPQWPTMVKIHKATQGLVTPNDWL